MAGKNVPGGADPWGGCFPGPGNTGVPAGTVLTDYTGPCTITVANTVIDAKRVTCSPLVINAANVKITRSFFDKGFINVGTGSVAVSDTNISMPSYDGTRGECCIADHDYTVTRTEFVGAYRGALCDHNCTVTDSWVHGQLPWAPTGQHASAIREGTRGTFVHNSLACDWPKPDDNSTLGCSGDLVGYPDQLVATVRDNTISRNLFVSTAGVLVSDGNRPVAVLAYCLYAGGSGSTNQKITENVFQKGQFGKCGDFGPVDAYNAGGSGNVFSGNRWDDGTIVTP